MEKLIEKTSYQKEKKNIFKVLRFKGLKVLRFCICYEILNQARQVTGRLLSVFGCRSCPVPRELTSVRAVDVAQVVEQMSIRNLPEK